MKLLEIGCSEKRTVYVNPDYIVSIEKDLCNPGHCLIETTMATYQVHAEADRVAKEINDLMDRRRFPL